MDLILFLIGSAALSYGAFHGSAGVLIVGGLLLALAFSIWRGGKREHHNASR